MIISMTGFSSIIITLSRPIGDTGTTQDLHLSLTLKTLNSRFFELNCKLPYSLSFLETELITYFKSRFYRGTIQLNIHMSDPSALTGVIEPAFSTVRGYLSAIDRIKEMYPISGTLSIGDLIALPNIFETRETPLEEHIVQKILSTIYELTDTCNQVRIQEGKALAKDLRNRIEVIRTYLNQLEPRAEVVLAQRKEELFATLKTALTETGQEAATDAQTTFIYNQLARMDIHEEIIRFKTHLESLSAIIDSDTIESGKKIDFTLQELVREINTIASKGSDAQMSRLAINTKVELEKAREQAQNIV